MSIASQLNRQYNKPRPKLALGLDSSSALTLLSTSSSTRSFSIGGGVLPLQPVKKQPLEEEKADALDDAREELEPARNSVHGSSRGPSEFESDRILAAMWLKSRCGSSVDLDYSLSMARPLRRNPAASTSSASSNSASAAAKASAVFAAKKNSIVRQCTACNLLYTAAHCCPGIGPNSDSK